jgi:hypothetical protein
MARKATQPALVGNLSQSKKGIATKEGVYVLAGTDWRYLTWREVDAIDVLRRELQAGRAVELELPDVQP